MKKKVIIKSILRDFHTTTAPSYYHREIQIPLNIGKIISLVGVRRSGKTYILYQLIDQLLKNISKEYILFINFEDERLDLSAEELDIILQSYRELYPSHLLNQCYFIFDEIQNVSGWEKFVRRLYDSISKNIVITGSNAKMLSSEISTSLRGRSISYEVFPLSFKEYLHFKNIPVDQHASQSRALIIHELENYLHQGGFPEIVFIADNRLQQKILQEYFQVMMFRDLIERYSIKNIPALKFFLKRLFSSATKQISINRIYNDLKSSGIKIGKNTLYKFLDEVNAIFLAGTVNKYSHKLSVQELGEKKIYIVDNGLLNSVIFKFSSDIGKSMEQVVYWELRRQDYDVFFYKNSYECDFLIFKNDILIDAIQVSYNIDDETTRKREIKGLLETCRSLNLKKGTLITFEKEEMITIDKINMQVLPLTKFLLNH